MSHPPSTVSASESTSEHLLFGDFRLITNPYQLLRNDEKIILQPQPSRLLALLAQHAGEILSREDIRRELWPGGAFLDHEQAINFAIRKIRIALGDEAKAPRFIETIPRLGYRFVASVKATSRPPKIQPVKSATQVPTLGPALVDPSAIHSGFSSEELTDDSPLEESLLAMEVAPASRFAWVLLAMVFLTLLILVPIGVGHEAFRATPELRLLEAVPPTTSHAMLERTSGFDSKLAPKLEELYLQGRFLVEQESTEQVQLGISKLRQVIDLDPSFAPAHYALALAFLQQAPAGNHFGSFMPEVEERVERALELDPNYAPAHWLRSVVLFYYRHDWDGAEAAVLRAITLQEEDFPEALRQLAMILAGRGRTSEAVDLLKLAVALDPAELLSRSDLVLCLMYDRRYGEALEASKMNLEVAPHGKASLFLDATLRYHLGDHEGALETFHAYFEAWGEPPPESNDAAFDWFFAFGASRLEQGQRAYLPVAMLHALTGNPEKSLDHLIEACEHDPHWELPMVGVDPRFDSLRELPAYRRLAGCTSPPPLR